MKKIPYKVRLGIGVGLVLWSIVAIIIVIVWGAYQAPIWALVLIPIVAFVFFIMGIIFVPKTNEDGTPIVMEKKPKLKKNKHKVKKRKRPFMTEEEWKQQEEEDDDMMFIEELVEDD